MKNRYETRGETTAIFVKWKGETYETLIDTEDLEMVKAFPNTWSAFTAHDLTYLYVIGHNTKVPGEKNTVSRLHRLITNCPKGMVVDHINHNTLDNRKENLRVLTHGENIQNQFVRENTSSGIRGVTWHKKSGKWAVKIKANGKNINLGLYSDKDEAADVAQKGLAMYLPGSIEAIHLKVDSNEVLNDPNKGYVTSKTGIRGVHWDKQRRKWKAQVMSRLSGKPKAVYQKHFETLEEAAAAVIEARKSLGIK